MALTSIDWLKDHLYDPNVRICDARWVLGAPGRGRAAWEAGHIPGAAFIDLDTELSGPDDGSAGRHPLPDPAAFAALLARLGISSATRVVAYDDAGGAVASRLWWMLRATGFADASVLDGGFTAWLAAGLPVSTEPPVFEPAPTRLVTFAEDRTIAREALQAALATHAVTLLDARAPERYRGETEPVDPRPGHIPGAINVPFANLLEGGRFLPADRLRARFEAAGVDLAQRPVIASCGSGVTACHLLLALDLCGLVPFDSGRLYPGSYSEWARQPDTEVRAGSAA
jgi:thiosulfate/3-mercaptopyruvate sulfurtransferase